MWFGHSVIENLFLHHYLQIFKCDMIRLSYVTESRAIMIKCLDAIKIRTDWCEGGRGGEIRTFDEAIKPDSLGCLQTGFISVRQTRSFRKINHRTRNLIQFSSPPQLLLPLPLWLRCLLADFSASVLLLLLLLLNGLRHQESLCSPPRNMISIFSSKLTRGWMRTCDCLSNISRKNLTRRRLS